MAITASQWGRRVEVTGSSPSGTLSGYAALITLDNVPVEMVDAGANSAENGGGDIRVCENSDGTNQLPLEVVSFVTSASAGSRECVLWVRFPTYSSAARSCWLFYNKPGETQPLVTDTFGRNAVWQDTLRCYHLESLVDSSGAQDLVASGGVSQSSSSKVGGGSYSFDGVDGALQSDLSVGSAYTVAAWVNLDSYEPDNKSVFSLASSLSGDYDWLLFRDGPDQDAFILSDSNTYASNDQKQTGTWYRIVGVFDYNNALKLYLDGTLSAQSAPISSSARDSVQDLTIGARKTAKAANREFFFEGLQEEFYIYSGEVGSDYIATEYANQSSPATFWSTGTPENTVGTSPSPQTITVTGIGSGEAVGSPVLTTEAIIISPNGIVSQEAFGSLQVDTGAVIITAEGIASEESVGTPDLLLSATLITPEGIPSEESIGDVVVQKLLQIIQASGIASEEEIGRHVVTGGDRIVVPAISRATFTKVMKFLETRQFEGALEDVILKWLSSEGYEGGWHTAWMDYLKDLGYTGSFTDMYAKWRRDQ